MISCAACLRAAGAAADFTLGQGFDCEVLAELAHIERVYAFDVQEQAIADARTYLADKTGFAKIRFICDGHEHLRRYIDEPLQLGVFNFGYYPRGNKTLTTRLRTSAQAVEGGWRESVERLEAAVPKRNVDPGYLSRPCGRKKRGRIFCAYDSGTAVTAF